MNKNEKKNQRQLNYILITLVGILLAYSIIATYLAMSYANSNNDSHWALLQRVSDLETKVQANDHTH